jgi:TolB-like protein/class 3 adenylate cyclase/Tfp pilus assembly protein PilF
LRSQRSVTAVLFTDIVGSTERAAELGDREWRKLQAEHHARVRREIRRFGGREANTAGDAFLAAFERPASAIRCAHAIRASLEEVGLAIRAGIHAGEVDGSGKNLGGIGVHTGQRVESAAAPGEILVSGTVRELVAGAGFQFEDRGEHELKGVPGRWRLYALTGLPPGAPFRTGRWMPEMSYRTAGIFAGVVVLAIAALLWRGVGGQDTADSAADVGSATTAPAVLAASIAVLPFENMSGDEEAQPFTDGLHDDLLTQLVKIGGLKVISRTSVLAYRDNPKPLSEIAEELGVATVLEGGVQRVENRVRVNVQLIDAATEAHLWAEVYDRDLTATNLFEIQREIAVEIARTLQARLTAEERERLAEVPTENLEAYERYLRGRDFFQRSLVLSAVRSAAGEFQAAVEADPEFAEAWARLSIARSSLSWEFGLNEELPAAEEAAERALALAPESPLSMAAMGYYRYYSHRDYDGALEWLRRSEAIAPNDPDMLAASGFVLRRQGKYREAVAYFERGVERDPRSLDLVESLAVSYMMLREYEAAERYLERAIAIAPEFPFTYRSLTELVLQRSGDVNAAAAIVERAAEHVDPARVVLPSNVLSRVLAGRFRDRLMATPPPPPTEGTFAIYTYTMDLNQLNVHLGKGFLLRELGEAALARTQFDSVVSISRRLGPSELDALFTAQGNLYGTLGLAQAAIGRAEDAVRNGRKGLASLEPEGDHFEAPKRRAELAAIYALVGERDAALEELQWLLANPSEYSPSLLRVDPLWDPLRDDPRFQRLLESSGTEQPSLQ